MQYCYSPETQKFINKLSRNRQHLTIEQEHNLIKELRLCETTERRKDEIKEIFISNTILWVVSKVRENNGIIDDDLLQVCSIGVLNALHNFDLSLNIKFITYANVHILKQKYIYITEVAPTVFIPTNVQKLKKKIQNLPENLSNYEIAEILKISEKDVSKILQVNPTYISKDNELSGLQIENEVTTNDSDFNENLTAYLSRISHKKALIVSYVLELNNEIRNFDEIGKMLQMHPKKVEVIFCQTMIDFGKEMEFGTKKNDFIGKFKQRIAEINSTNIKFNDKQRELF